MFKSFSLRVRVVAAWAAALLFLPVTPAVAEVEEILIGAIRDFGQGWSFEIDVEGSDLVSLTIVFPPPSGRTEMGSGGSFSLTYDDPMGPFATFADLQARNPAGDYMITIVDAQGTKEVELTWNPTLPQNGSGGEATTSLVFPQADSTLGCRGPDLTYASDCTNCNTIDSEIFGLSGQNVSIGIFQQGGTLPNPIPFELSENDDGSPATALPDGNYEVEMLVGNITVDSGRGFDMGPADSFDYVEEASTADLKEFSVTGTTQDFQEILIGAINQQVATSTSEWIFEIETFGFVLCSVRIDGPGAQQYYLPGGGPSDFELDLGPYASLAALQSAHPAGTYTVTVNQDWTDDVLWDPTLPIGASGEPFARVTSPAVGSTIQDTTPDIAYELDCTNCPSYDLELYDIPTDGNSVQVGLSGPLPLPASPILFSSLRDDFDMPPAPLADDDYEVNIEIGFYTTFAGSLTGPAMATDAFAFEEEASVIAESQFTVPEPGATGSGVAAAAALAGLARRRRAG